MNTQRPMQRRLRLLPAMILAVLPFGAAVAQEEARELDRVEVTGSRIKSAAIQGQTPVQVISREDIARSGLSSVADILQQLTASGSALNTKFNSSGNFGFPPDGSGVGAGSATIDLRHLGSKRVLVLVDGIRWVNEASASGVSASTDLNTIPVNIIESIEILEDGASAIYGSDAIAGVVNIITRRNFDGAAISASFGEFDEGDGATTTAEVSLGKTGDGFSFFFGASYTEQDPIESKDRSISAFPVPNLGLAFGSSATPFGRFVFNDPRTGAAADITLDGTFAGQLPTYNPNNPGVDDDFHPFTSADRFNFAQFNYLLTPSERKSIFTQTRFEFTETTSWYIRALFNQRRSENRAAPEPIFLGPDAGTGNPLADNIFISSRNQFNPFGIDFDGSGDNIVFFGRRPVEGGARRFFQDVDTWYFSTGLDGVFDLGDKQFYWDVNYVRSKNEAEQTNFGSYNIRRIATALGTPETCAADPACTPLNIFGGPGTITPEMLAYIQPIIRDRSENNLQLFSANISGDVADLWAGPLAIAAGYEHRNLDGSYLPDALTVAGEYNGVPSLPTSGSYDVDEFFIEANLPVYDNDSSRLDFSAALRYSDYSTSGGENTGKLGFRWQIGDQFLIRGSAAEGFRAPSIGELFGSAARFDATLTDPCVIGINGAPPTGPASICSQFGIPASAQQANPQISVTTGGNINLEPETSDSYSLGFVWSPSFMVDSGWAEKFDIEFTWYQHELEGAIQAIDAQTQLNICSGLVPSLDAGGSNSVFCNGITRAVTGGINGFNNRLQNFGEIETDGFDLDMFWTLPQTDYGVFRASWRNTFVNDYEAVDSLGSAQPQGAGVEVNNSGIPEWVSNFTLDWAKNDWSASWSVRHTDALTENCSDFVGLGVCSNDAAGTNNLGSTTYHDLQVSWASKWVGDMRLTGGVNNATDKDAPFCYSCSLNGYDASNYDLPGRFYYVKVDFKF